MPQEREHLEPRTIRVAGLQLPGPGDLLLLASFALATVAAVLLPGYPPVATVASGVWALLFLRVGVLSLTHLARQRVKNQEERERKASLAAEDCLRLAHGSMRAGRWEEALQHLDELEHREPGRLDVALASAEALKAAGRPDDAVRRIGAVRESYAGESEFHLALARAACAAREFEMAREEVESLASLDARWWAMAATDPELWRLREWVEARAGIARGY